MAVDFAEIAAAAAQDAITAVGTVLGIQQQQATAGALNQLLANVQLSLDGINRTLALLQTTLGTVQELGRPQQANQAVILPSRPPSIYVAPTVTENANAVWGYVLPGSGSQAGTVMDALYDFVSYFDGYVGLPIEGSDIMLGFFNSFYPAEFPFNAVPRISSGQILATDLTVLAFLNRVWSTTPWVLDAASGLYYTTDNVVNPAVYYCTLTAATFGLYQAALAGKLGGGTVPPVWPGLANVTLGAAVALAPPGQTIVGPLDGVIMSITATPTPLPYYQFDTFVSYGKIGSISFVDDNGKAETAQPLGFTSALFTPKSMKIAQSAILRLTSGVAGTVTPWTAT